MKPALFLVLAVMMAGAAAHSIFDFDDWMQRIDDSSQDLQRHIAKRDVAAAQGAAREIEEMYGLMQEFFEKRADAADAADAVRWSREGREFAQRAQAALKSGQFVIAKRHALAIAHGCRDCHFHFKPL